MKKVEAIIKPFKLDDVRTELSRIGVNGMTVYDIQGYGNQRGHTELYRGAEYEVAFLPKVKLELVVADEILDQVVQAIQDKSRTGTTGDGKVFIFHVEESIRIRTGERGKRAV